MRRLPRFRPSLGLEDARAFLGAGDEAEPVERFEREFAAATGAWHAVMVPSGRYGCFLVLEALGIGPGDEVILPALTYFAVPAMVALLGARPVFADVGDGTHVLDPASVEACLTPRTRAIVATHLYGTPCDMDALGALARRRHVHLVEDCCQAAGATHRGRTVGSMGVAGFFTFGVTKNMTTVLGGMIATRDAVVAERARARMRGTQPMPREKLTREAVKGLAMVLATTPGFYDIAVHSAIRLGTRFGTDIVDGRFAEVERLPTVLPDDFHHGRPRPEQAAVGLVQLGRLAARNEARRTHGMALSAALTGVPGLRRPSHPPGSEPIYMSFVVEHPRRNELARRLRARGVDTATGFMSNLSAHPAFPDRRVDCPRARRAIAEMLHLPVYPHLRPADVVHVADAVRAAVAEMVDTGPSLPRE